MAKWLKIVGMSQCFILIGGLSINGPWLFLGIMLIATQSERFTNEQNRRTVRIKHAFNSMTAAL